MCEPTTIGLVVGGLSAVNSAQQASAQYDAQAAAYKANVDASIKAKADTDRQINLNQAQTEEKAAQEKIATDLQVRQSTSRAMVAGAESGAFLNNNAVVADMVRQGLVANTMVSQNLDREAAQRAESRDAAHSTYQSRINSVARPTWDRGSVLLGSVMQGVSTGLSAAGAAGMAGIGSGGAAAGGAVKPPDVFGANGQQIFHSPVSRPNFNWG